MGYKLSVVLPVYNGEKYIKEAIESILNQTFTDFEFIIINDGSTDNTLDIINSFLCDERIKIITRDNKGLIYSLNEGLNLASGQYIARMDADDISLDTRFEKQIELLDRGFDICGCHYFQISENGEYMSSNICPVSYNDIILFLTRTVPFAHGSVMLRTEFIRKNNLSYGNTNYLKAEDFALWLDFFNKGARFSNVDDFLFKYRYVPMSLSKCKSNREDANKLASIFIKNNEDLILKTLINNSSYNENVNIIKVHLFFVFLLKFKINKFKRGKITKNQYLLGLMMFLSLFKK